MLLKKFYLTSLLMVLLLPGLSVATEKSYEFHGEGEALLKFIEAPPYGQNYCSLRFYINPQLIIYAITKQPGAKGLKIGDRLVSINGEPIEGPLSIPDAVRSLTSKDKMKLVVDRKGKPVELERECSDDTKIDNTIKSLAEAIITENWSECRKIVKKVEQHEKRSEWIDIRMRCNYMHAKTNNNLAIYWNSNWPFDVYQYNREVLKAARYGSMQEFETLRPSLLQAISDLERNGRGMYSGDLRNDFDATVLSLQVRDGIIEAEEE